MSVYQFGPFYLDTSRMLLLDAGEPVALGPKVVETLLALIEHPGDVVTKDALRDRIWPEGYVDEANLQQNVHVLRKTMRSRWGVNAIETIPRRGYRFASEVRLLTRLPAAEPLRASSSPPRLWRALVALGLAAIAGCLLAFDRPPGTAHPTELSPNGARLYEIGRYYWNTRTAEGVSKSLAYFARVIDSDPENARGYAALAAADAIMADYHYGTSSPGAYYARAVTYAKKALILDPNCSDAYAVLGMVATKKDTTATTRLVGGIDQLRHAVALDQFDGPAHEWLGIALLSAGHVNESYSELQKAAFLDPLSVATTTWLSWASYLNGRYADAIVYANQTLDLSPHRYEVLETLGLAYEARGQLEAAVNTFRRLAVECATCRAEAAALLAGAYARENRPRDAWAEIDVAQAKPNAVHPEDLGIALVWLGKRKAGMAWLRRMHDPETRTQIANDPRFNILRGDPQFSQLEQFVPS
jgi:DNA-binding winged helix-turn-helix (wHTH) protein/Flp pilus assembly protein TadD